MQKKRKQICLTLFSYVILALCLLAVAFVLGGHLWGNIKKNVVPFEESARELSNPNRGFYYIYDFWITDEEIDYEQAVSERYEKDTDTELTMIQVCLQDYREGEITQAGMNHIEALFQALEAVDKQLIVRFVYDRDGENLLYEPQDIQIILGHMRQLEHVLREHSSQIFTLQGAFVGNWGEMHSTKYESEEDMRILIQQLADVTDQSTYLAVRTPVQWRMITQSSGMEDGPAQYSALKKRLGLFNDGMLGNETDYGTYGTEEGSEANKYLKWSRGYELDFQDDICDIVPNGGEVIVPNEYNDIDSAIEDMKTMHVTYLNKDYDAAVFEKWTGSTVQEDSVFDGMDGTTYVERHLGYRFLIDHVEFIHSLWEKHLFVTVYLKNTGFAPMYREPEATLHIYNKESGQVISQELTCNLTGEQEKPSEIRADIDIDQLPEGKYELYFELTDPSTGKQIQLANKQDIGEYGYLIGDLAAGGEK